MVIYWLTLGGCLAVNIVCMAMSLWRMRQYGILNRMLVHLCMEAWKMRAWPLHRVVTSDAELEELAAIAARELRRRR